MNLHRSALLLAIVTLVVGCAGRPIPPTPADPRAFATEPWKSPNQLGNPLVGYVLATRGERWVGAEELEAAVAAADFVFLGETHDNPDHHRLQAALLRAAAGGAGKRTLAFEMFDTSQAETLSRVQSTPPVTPDSIAEATKWKDSGWPDFSAYRPIFEVGLEAGLPIVAANLPRSVAREVVRKGLAPLPEPVRELMEKAGPPSPAELKAWAKEMEENHCQELDPGLLEGLVRAQRARDAQMALVLAAAADGGGAVLITGDGHARSDRGVPAWLARIRPGARSVAVGILEVDGDLKWPRQYAEQFGSDGLPFDYVVFTPRAEREDPCEPLRKRKRDAAKP